MATASAHASHYIYIDGQTSEVADGVSYSHYLENVNTTVADQKLVNSDGANGAFGSSSSPGSLKAYSHAATTGVNLPIEPYIWARAQYTDVILVEGSGPVTMSFTMPTTGTLDPGSWDALGSASLDVGTQDAQLLFLTYRVHMNNGSETVERNVMSGQVTVDPGTRIYLHGTLVAAIKMVRSNPLALMSGVDFSHTSESFISLLTPGGSLLSESGHSYSVTSGDFNEDGYVGAADLTAWATGFGTPSGATHLQGDADGDSDVDGGDFLVWQRQLESAPAFIATIAAPEPHSFLLSSLALFGFSCARRRFYGKC
jgi:hypothetical protein